MKLWRNANIDSKNFRADNEFLWQTRLYEPANYFISYLEAKRVDSLGVLESSPEDRSYGAECFFFENRSVSRDLIDSTLEINFLAKNLCDFDSSGFCVLDIGAGYGRIGRRLLDTLKEIKYIATDAVPKSQHMSKIYLASFLKSNRAQILDLHEISSIKRGQVDLAINIHSFSEMSLEYVRFWLDYIVRIEVKYLFIVPNNNALKLNDGTSFEADIYDRGFSLSVIEEKYPTPELRSLGIYPDTFYLFKKE